MCCGCTSYRPCEAYCMTRLWRVRNRAGISYPPLAACAMALGWDGDNTANTEIKITVTLRERQKLVNKGMQNVFPRVRERLLVSKQDAEFFTKFLFFFFFQPAYNPHKRCPHPLLTHDFWDKKRPWSVVLYLQSPPALSSSSSGKPKSRSLFDLLSVSGSLSAGCSKKKKKKMFCFHWYRQILHSNYIYDRSVFSLAQQNGCTCFPPPESAQAFIPVSDYCLCRIFSFHSWILNASFLLLGWLLSVHWSAVFAACSPVHLVATHSPDTAAALALSTFVFRLPHIVNDAPRTSSPETKQDNLRNQETKFFFFFLDQCSLHSAIFVSGAGLLTLSGPCCQLLGIWVERKSKMFFFFFFFFHLSEESLFSFKLPLASSEPRNATK